MMSSTSSAGISRGTTPYLDSAVIEPTATGGALSITTIGRSNWPAHQADQSRRTRSQSSSVNGCGQGHSDFMA